MENNRGCLLDKKSSTKGFTLIELLAVIVILVIIALITTPLILNVINDSKEKARLRSIKNIEDQAYFYYAKYALVSDQASGNIFNSVMEIMKGEKPDKGEIFIKKDEKIGYALKYGDTCYKKKYDESVVTKIEHTEECTLVNTKNYLRYANNNLNAWSNVDEDTPFLNGPIARNTIEKITFLGHQEMGVNVIDSWDVSKQENNSILAWYKDENSNGLYEVYIGGDGMVVANPQSYSLFNGIKNLIEIDLEALYTSNVTDMSHMFENCESLIELNINDLDTSNVTDMYYMFNNCRSLKELNLNNWDTSKVEDMRGIFLDCESLTELKINDWNTSKVTTMYYMFRYCSSLTELNINDWDTSNVTDMSQMFICCKDLKKLNIDKWNTSNVTDMSSMFHGCESLMKLNINDWDTSKVTTMSYMFSGCKSLTELNINNWDTSNVTNIGGMFRNCSSLASLNISNWDTSNVIYMSSMFDGCSNLAELNISNWDTSRVTTMSNMFRSCKGLTTIQANSAIKDSIESAVTEAGLTGVTVSV